MLNTQLQTRFAEATADLFDFYARTGTRLAWASADQGLALWLGALQFAARRTDARLNEWRNAFQPWMDLSVSFLEDANTARCGHDASPQASEEPEAAYASYRTAGGHATAQVIVSGRRV